MSETSTRIELARVVHIADKYGEVFEVVINKGFAQGTKAGDRFLVFGHGPEIKDPDTGANLGVLEVIRGRGVVVHVQENMSTLKSVEKNTRASPVKRVIRQSGLSVFTHVKGDTVEETEIREESLPFKDVALGDFARPV